MERSVGIKFAYYINHCAPVEVQTEVIVNV